MNVEMSVSWLELTLERVTPRVAMGCRVCQSIERQRTKDERATVVFPGPKGHSWFTKREAGIVCLGNRVGGDRRFGVLSLVRHSINLRAVLRLVHSNMCLKASNASIDQN
jgi:hypothetical protein